MKIDLQQIRDLLDIVSKTDITELTIEIGEEKVTIKKSGPLAQSVQLDLSAEKPAMILNPAPARSPELSFEPKPQAHEASSEGSAGLNGLVPVTSPMVGTFYRASTPTANPYVEVGDRISVGQTVCIIEAMKLMNDMPSEVAGKIVKVCVENGSTVEYGQQLFLVDPKG
ncbi:MAG: acetyl-CoA carboxylase biotin carboxyl carrier protein [Candidatus Melainabacteria bacterium]|nr:MAG: acetyl-CoA carboxylase biotin carboxyl carrier protein [Candidatus Melainabacteria bacterium]